MSDSELATVRYDLAGTHEFDDETAEHISLGEESVDRADIDRTVSNRVVIHDKLRARGTFITFYDQGFLEIIERRGSKSSRCLPIDLRYLDPKPSIELRVPTQLIKICGGLAAAATLVGVLAAFGIASAFTIPASAAAFAAALMGGIGCFYLTHEEIRFFTLHGRAMTFRLTAGLGSIGRYRSVVPRIIDAIGEAAEDVGHDTMIYLRSEMREHYRLRGVGILSDSECSDSTARILARFDDPGVVAER